MRKLLKAIIALLVIGLLANTYGIYRLSEAERRISNQAYSNQRYAQKGMDTNLKQIQEDLSDIKNNLWVSSMSFAPNVGTSTPEEIHLNFLWSLSEVEKGARIYIRYRDKALPGMWIEAEAEMEDINSYSTKIKLAPNSDYVYQIVSEGSYIKVNEIADVPTEYYKPVPFKISGWGYSSSGGKVLDFRVTFSQDDPIYDFYRIKNVSASLQFPEGEEEMELKASDNGRSGQSWDLEFEEMQGDFNLERLIIEIEYDGGIVEKDFTYEVLEKIYEVMSFQEGL